MLELYHASISTCSQKVRLCLAEKQLAWVDRRIDFATREHLQPDYLALNPNGVVPTLLHNKQPVIDSSVICEYLEETFPCNDHSLVPNNTLDRARMRAWLRYIEEVPTTAIRYPSFNKLFTNFFQSMDETTYSMHVEKVPLRKEFYRQFNRDGFSEQSINASLSRLVQVIERIDAATAEHTFLVGSTLTLADICMLPTIVRMEDLELDNLWRGKEHFEKWYKRLKHRSSFNLAFYSGSRVVLEGNAL